MYKVIPLTNSEETSWFSQNSDLTLAILRMADNKTLLQFSRVDKFGYEHISRVCREKTIALGLPKETANKDGLNSKKTYFFLKKFIKEFPGMLQDIKDTPQRRIVSVNQSPKLIACLILYNKNLIYNIAPDPRTNEKPNFISAFRMLFELEFFRFEPIGDIPFDFRKPKGKQLPPITHSGNQEKAVKDQLVQKAAKEIVPFIAFNLLILNRLNNLDNTKQDCIKKFYLYPSFPKNMNGPQEIESYQPIYHVRNMVLMFIQNAAIETNLKELANELVEFILKMPSDSQKDDIEKIIYTYIKVKDYIKAITLFEFLLTLTNNPDIHTCASAVIAYAHQNKPEEAKTTLNRITSKDCPKQNESLLAIIDHCVELQMTELANLAFKKLQIGQETIRTNFITTFKKLLSKASPLDNGKLVLEWIKQTACHCIDIEQDHILYQLWPHLNASTQQYNKAVTTIIEKLITEQQYQEAASLCMKLNPQAPFDQRLSNVVLKLFQENQDDLALTFLLQVPDSAKQTIYTTLTERGMQEQADTVNRFITTLDTSAQQAETPDTKHSERPAKRKHATMAQA